MIRYLAGVASALLMVAAGVFIWKSMARADDPLPPPGKGRPLIIASQPLADPPAAPERSREEKRFDRYDKDKNEIIARAEYMAPRQKAFGKLDANGDGRLSFEEWALKTTTKFAGADADRSGTLTRAEFATTKVKRKSPSKCVCTPARDGDQRED